MRLTSHHPSKRESQYRSAGFFIAGNTNYLRHSGVDLSSPSRMYLIVIPAVYIYHPGLAPGSTNHSQ